MRILNLVLLVFFIVVSCTKEEKSKDNKIMLINNIYYNMSSGERELQAPSDVLDFYSDRFNNYNDIQIPLFKYFVHKDYKVFIGMPMATKISEILANESTLNIENPYVLLDKGAYQRQYVNDGYSIVERLEVFENNTVLNLIFVSSLLEDKQNATKSMDLAQKITLIKT